MNNSRYDIGMLINNSEFNNYLHDIIQKEVNKAVSKELESRGIEKRKKNPFDVRIYRGSKPLDRSVVIKNNYNNDIFKEEQLEYDFDNEIDVKDLAYEGRYDNYNVTTALGEYLKKNGISKTWLSLQTGINRVTVTNLISKPNTISLLNAYKICAVLGEPINVVFPFIELVNEENKNNNKDSEK